MTGDFFVRPQIDTGTATVAIGGEIDTYTSPEVSRALDEAIRAAVPSVEVDLSEVTFVDSSGLAALIGGAKQARAHGAAYKVVGASANLRRVFEIAGLNEILGVDPA